MSFSRTANSKRLIGSTGFGLVLALGLMGSAANLAYAADDTVPLISALNVLAPAGQAFAFDPDVNINMPVHPEFQPVQARAAELLLASAGLSQRVAGAVIYVAPAKPAAPEIAAAAPAPALSVDPEPSAPVAPVAPVANTNLMPATMMSAPVFSANEHLAAPASPAAPAPVIQADVAPEAVEQPAKPMLTAASPVSGDEIVLGRAQTAAPVVAPAPASVSASVSASVPAVTAMPMAEQQMDAVLPAHAPASAPVVQDAQPVAAEAAPITNLVAPSAGSDAPVVASAAPAVQAEAAPPAVVSPAPLEVAPAEPAPLEIAAPSQPATALPPTAAMQNSVPRAAEGDPVATAATKANSDAQLVGSTGVASNTTAAAPVGANVWKADRGETLRSVLESWCNQAGVQLVWSTDFDYPLQASISVNDGFEAAVRTLLTGFSAISPQPVGRLHRQGNAGQRVLVIETRGNLYQDHQ